MEKRPGLSDRDDWFGWWQGLHHSDNLAGELARCALRHIEGPDFSEGVGSEVLRFEEYGRIIEVEVGYLLEQFPGGRIFTSNTYGAPATHRVHPSNAARYRPGVTDDHVLANRTLWDADADNWVERGREAWAREDILWGAWSIPEADLRVLPDVDGLDVVELGCGTAYWAAWFARRGARVVGLDNSGRQLATARGFQEEFGLRFPLVHADAERPPFRDGTFDLAFSEYGAAIWCDPYRWIPEAARLLRPGGRLIFLGGHPLLMLCYPADDDEAPAEFHLHREYFGMHRVEWHDTDGTVDGIEFRLPHGEMIRLLRRCGFEVEDLVEVQVPETAETPHDIAPPEWVKRYPPEQIWVARKRAVSP